MPLIYPLCACKNVKVLYQISMQVCKECRSSCAAGEYIHKDDCNGTGIYDRQCTKCKTQCPKGFFMKGKCDRTGTTDGITCEPCDACAHGQYISRACNGLAFVDNRVCSQCTSKCPLGEVLTQTCPGTTEVDISLCAPCPAQCSIGEYIYNGCLQGQSSWTCEQCTTLCQDGQYLVGECNGLSTSGTYCVDCRDRCRPGEYMYSACTRRGDADGIFDFFAENGYLQGISEGRVKSSSTRDSSGMIDAHIVFISLMDRPKDTPTCTIAPIRTIQLMGLLKSTGAF